MLDQRDSRKVLGRFCELGQESPLAGAPNASAHLQCQHWRPATRMRSLSATAASRLAIHARRWACVLPLKMGPCMWSTLAPLPQACKICMVLVCSGAERAPTRPQHIGAVASGALPPCISPTDTPTAHQPPVRWLCSAYALASTRGAACQGGK